MSEPEAVIQDAVNSTPEVMAALMRQFISRKDVESRVQIKMQMKAILDLVSVDTTFPENNLPDSKVSAARGAEPRPNIVGGAAFAGGIDGQACAPAPAQRLGNQDIIQ